MRLVKKTIILLTMLLLVMGTLLLLPVTAEAADDQTVYGNRGSWTAPDGTIWLYVEKGTDEAAVYGVENAMLELEMPSYVYDENGNGRKVIAAISEREAFNNNNGYYKFIYAGRMKEYVPYSLSFPNTVSYIGNWAFEGSDGSDDDDEDDEEEIMYDPWTFLAEIELPQNPLLVIGYEAFCQELNLQQVTFRAEILKAQPAEIGRRAFAYCPKLTKISFPDNSTIESDVLEGCINLKEIVNAPEYLDMGEECSLEKISYASGAETISGLHLSNGRTNDTLTTVTLPEGVTTISYYAFCNCTALTTINLPEGLKEIHDWAFYGCEELNSFTTLPSTLETIGGKAFMGCKNLHLSVTYPSTAIYYLDSFVNSGITDIYFSKNLLNISWYGFRGCSDLRSIRVESGSSRYYSVDGILYCNYNKYDANGNVIEKQPGIMIYPAGKSYVGSYTIPADVKGLGGLAFDSCKFTEIRIPVTVESFGGGFVEEPSGEYRFCGVFDNMASNCVLYMVKNSYADSYADVADLYEHRYMAGSPVKITYKLNGGTNNAANPSTFVGGDTIHLKNPTRAGYKFAGWNVEDEELYATGWWEDEETTKSQYIPIRKELIKGVTFVANWTKDNSVSDSGNAVEKTISNASYKLYADGTAEYVAPSAPAAKTSVTVPNNVKSSGKTYKVTKVSGQAFSKCKKLKSVTIGKNIKEIGSKAFQGCSKLKKITVKSKQLSKVGKKAFKGIHKKAKIKVPKAKLKVYQKLLKGKGQAKSVKITK